MSWLAERFGGRANQDPVTGEYYIMDLDGYTWSGACTWSAATTSVNNWVPQE